MPVGAAAVREDPADAAATRSHCSSGRDGGGRAATQPSGQGRRSLRAGDSRNSTRRLFTQNVMSLGRGAARQEWFSHFRQRQDLGALDLVCLQETRISEDDVADVARRYLRSWGFADEQDGRRFSAWSTSTGRSGDVGILLSPYSAISTLTPYREADWSPHWMAVSVELHGASLVVVNCYAPSARAAREELFDELRQVLAAAPRPILLGGDLNCTLDPVLDRSHPTASSVHDSKMLRQMLRECELVDTLEDEAERAHEESDVVEFHRRHHTYFYTLPDGRPASCRLDRWYCSEEHEDWMRALSTTVPGPFSDHSGVAARIAAPGKLVQVKKQRTVYPPPRYAETATAQVTAGFFERAAAQLDDTVAAHSDPERRARAAANWWDGAKICLRKGYLAAKRDARRKTTAGYRQTLKRLGDKLEAVSRASVSRATHHISVSGEADEGAALSVRRAISDCRARWQAAKRRALIRTHTRHPARSTRYFFRRVSNKFLDNTVYSLGGSARHGPTRSRELANDMRAGWCDVMQQTEASNGTIEDFVSSLPARPKVKGLEVLCDGVTEADVRQAIRKCQRGKARGPDELGNDWYRDNVDDLVPLFTGLCNIWMEGGALPKTFSDAHICIKKNRSVSVPLDYRPIALLDTDYKVFTRVFATRLRRHLPNVVHPLQAGFAPGRTMDNIVDLFGAAKIAVRYDPGREQSAALLLDFAKAYDSLGRRFLLAALRHHSFTDSFVRIIDNLHENTRCRFMVNGYLSRWLTVTCGIRQGCPLAPLLFILVLDLLYSKIESADGLTGVPLASQSEQMTVKVCGYADDTAVYIGSPSEASTVLQILTQFGAASGLRVNAAKSTAVPLRLGVAIDSALLGGVTLLRGEEHCRYLGVQVSAGETAAANWEGCVRAKTNTPRLRALLAATIVVPKIHFATRHVWPTPATVDRLQQLIKRFVWGARDGKQTQAWMGEYQAELPESDGGVEIPNVRAELLTMAATAVGKWATGATGVGRLTGGILMTSRLNTDTYLTPGHVEEPSTQTRWLATMRGAGAVVVRETHCDPLSATELAIIRDTEAVMRAQLSAARRESGKLIFEMDDATMQTASSFKRQWSAFRGPFCDEWLKYASLDTATWLRDRQGEPFGAGTFARATDSRRKLGDVLDWDWRIKGSIVFSLREHTDPPATTRRAAAKLCETLLFNFPQLLYQPHTRELLRAVDVDLHQHNSWKLAENGSSIVCADATLEREARAVRSMADCERAATSDVPGATVRFLGHPALSRLVQFYGNGGRLRPQRRRCSETVRQECRAKGKKARDRAIAVQARDSRAVHDAMAQLKWREIRRAPGVSAYAAQTVFWIKANKLNTWNNDGDNRSCPHRTCSNTEPATVQHVFWTCPVAVSTWIDFRTRWRSLGDNLEDDFLSSCFSLELPDTPLNAWSVVRTNLDDGEDEDELLDELYPAARLLWRFMATTTIHAVWCARLRLRDEPEAAAATLRAVVNATIHRGLALLRQLMRDFDDKAHATPRVEVLAALSATLQELQIKNTDECVRPLPTRSIYLLFFDGGSRGDPGPGGAGSVLVRLDTDSHAAKIYWASSMSYACANTTNNTAEYWGLIHGLHRAAAASCTSLHVIGDSAMIIRQQQQHRPPRHPRLRQLYLKARRCAGGLGVRSWTHHYREYNKMADRAANIAMDTALSQQSTAENRRPILADLERHLDNDVRQWISRGTTMQQITVESDLTVEASAQQTLTEWSTQR